MLQQQQKHKGSQANILENFQMTTERGCLETATLQLWNLQKYKQRKRQMDGDRHLSFQRKPTVLLSELWEKVDKELPDLLGSRNLSIQNISSNSPSASSAGCFITPVLATCPWMGTTFPSGGAHFSRLTTEKIYSQRHDS